MARDDGHRSSPGELVRRRLRSSLIKADNYLQTRKFSDPRQGFNQTDGDRTRFSLGDLENSSKQIRCNWFQGATIN